MFDKLKSAASALAGQTGEFFNLGLDKLKTTTDEVMASSPQLKEVGYRITDVELEFAAMPRAVVYLIKDFEASAEAYSGVLREHAGKKTLCTVVKMLQQVDYVQKRIKINGRQFKELALEMGIPPSMRLKYVEIPETPPRPTDTTAEQ